MTRLHDAETSDLNLRIEEMEMHRKDSHAKGFFSRRLAWLLGLVAVMVLGACDFDATDPTSITEDDLSSDAAMTAMMVGAVYNYDYSYNRQIMFTGLIADELVAAGSWDPWHQADQNGILDQFASESDHINIPWRMWRDLQRARVSAIETLERMEDVVPEFSSDERVAMMSLYAGIAYADFGEIFCEAAFDGGPAVERSETFNLAEGKLDQARQIAQASGVDSIAHMAHLVQARIELDQGDMDAALAAAEQVPDGLVWEANFRDASGERAYFWTNNHDRGESSVHPDFRGSDDPRTPTQDQGRLGPDTNTPVWAQMKYPTYNSNMIVGSWREARLIEAEVHLSRGQVEPALELVNQVRGDWDLEPLSTDLSEAEALSTFEEEKRASTWMEGRRMIDMRRWDAFPDGWDATCVPISREERLSNLNLPNL
jgi:hypothetical protein